MDWDDIILVVLHRKPKDRQSLVRTVTACRPEPGSFKDVVPAQVSVPYECTTFPSEKHLEVTQTMLHSFCRLVCNWDGWPGQVLNSSTADVLHGSNIPVTRRAQVLRAYKRLKNIRIPSASEPLIIFWRGVEILQGKLGNISRNKWLARSLVLRVKSLGWIVVPSRRAPLFYSTRYEIVWGTTVYQRLFQPCQFWVRRIHSKAVWGSGKD